MLRHRPAVLAALGLVAVVAAPVQADEPAFTDAFMNDPEQLALGQELFQQQCARCHGKGAYPGKASPLKPHKLSPEDVYLRITYGFRRMPPWEDVFSDAERAAITAYVKSDRFSN